MYMYKISHFSPPVLIAPAMDCSVIAGRVLKARPFVSKYSTTSPRVVPALTVTYITNNLNKGDSYSVNNKRQELYASQLILSWS